MPSTIKFRRGTSAEWESKNPILSVAETGYETDTKFFKIGDGFSHWLDLPYFVDGLTEQGLTQAMIEDAIAALPGGGGGSDELIGNMLTLTTTNKSSVVEAINEVNTPYISLITLYANAKAG